MHEGTDIAVRPLCRHPFGKCSEEVEVGGDELRLGDAFEQHRAAGERDQRAVRGIGGRGLNGGEIGKYGVIEGNDIDATGARGEVGDDVIAAVGRGGEKGLLRGAAVGLLYMGLGVSLYALLTGQNLPFTSYLGDLGMGLAGGGLTGMILSNLSAK